SRAGPGEHASSCGRVPYVAISESVAPSALTKPLRVAIDVTSLAGPRTGVGHVTAAIVEELAGRPDVSLVAYAVTRHRRVAAMLRLPPGVPLRVTAVPARVLFEAWRLAP